MKVYVSTIVEKDDKYLMVKEAKKSCYGKWNVPSGHVEEDEYVLDGAIREVKEETNLDVKLTSLISVYNNLFDGFNAISFVFASNIVNLNEIKFNENEILEVKWFSFEEIKNMKEELRDYDYVSKSIERLNAGDVKSLDTIIIR